jgi:hypothetical protein
VPQQATTLYRHQKHQCAESLDAFAKKLEEDPDFKSLVVSSICIDFSSFINCKEREGGIVR